MTLAVAGMIELRITAALLALSLLGTVLTFAFRSSKTLVTVRAMLLTASIALGAFAVKETQIYRPLIRTSGTIRTVTVEICEVAVSDTGSGYYTVEVRSGSLPEDTRLCLYLKRNEEIYARRDLLTLDVSLQAEESGSESPQPFRRMKADNVYLYAWQSGSVTYEGRAEQTISGWFADLREAASGKLSSVMDADAAAVTTAVCLGDKSGVSSEIVEAFRRGGVAHLLVVSGLHMSILSTGLFSLLKRRIPRRAAAICALCATLLFSLLVGLSASVVRAAILNGLWLIGNCFRRRPDSRNSLGLALLVLLASDCFAVYDLGLLLSFGSSWGIVVVYPVLHSAVLSKCKTDTLVKRLAAKVVSAFCVTLSATLPLLPVTIYVYGELSLTSVLTNVLTVFPTELLLWCGFAAVFLLTIWQPLGVPAAFCAELLSRYLIGTTGLLGGENAVITIRGAYIFLAIFGAVALLFVGWIFLKWRGVRMAAALSVIVLCSGILLHTVWMRGVTEITALSAECGTVLLIERDGRAGVVLTGENESWRCARTSLKARGITKLDFVTVIGENADTDGYAAFVRAIDTEIVLISSESEILKEYLPSQKTALLPVHYRAETWGDGCITALHGGYWNIRFGDTSVLVCPREGNTSMLSEAEQTADVVVFQATAPQDANLIQAKLGIWFCEAERLSEGEPTLPRGTYSLLSIRVDGEQRLTTRGQGDIYIG